MEQSPQQQNLDFTERTPEHSTVPAMGVPGLESLEDFVRVAHQRVAVMRLMRDGAWRTLGQIEAATGYPQASISARLRDFRKPQYGAHKVDRRHVSRGLHEYRVVVRTPDKGR